MPLHALGQKKYRWGVLLVQPEIIIDSVQRSGLSITKHASGTAECMVSRYWINMSMYNS